MYIGALILTVHFLYIYAFGIGNVQEKVAVFDNVDGFCGGREGILVTCDFGNYTIVKNKLLFRVILTVKQNIDYAPAFALDIKRCRTDNITQCENFQTFKTAKYCSIIQSSSSVWNTVFATMKPKMKCPLKKGAYVSENSELDLTSFLLLPMDGWTWVTTSDLRDRAGNLMMCFTLNMRFDIKKKT